MAVGKSGRIVVEIDPEFKEALHAALQEDGSTLKAWFILAAENYLAGRRAPDRSLFSVLSDVLDAEDDGEDDGEIDGPRRREALSTGCRTSL